MFLIQGDAVAMEIIRQTARGMRMYTMTFMKKFDQSFAELKAFAEPHLRRLYKEAVDSYINFRKRGTILFKAFCHNTVNFCMGLSLKSFAALTLVPAIVLLVSIDVSSKGERDAKQLRASIAAQLAHSRTNTQAAAAAAAQAAAAVRGTQLPGQSGAAASLIQNTADNKKIVPPMISADAFMSFVDNEQTPRDAEAYLREGMKAAQKIEPAAGR